MINLAFITGARSEYSLSKKLLSALYKDKLIELKIYVTGLHLLKKYGYTIDEIKNDGFLIRKEISIYKEEGEEKAFEFIKGIETIYKEIKNEKIDYAYFIGDRLEAYAAALACHFLEIPIIHTGGGNITNGAVDNIYRYNITNLASIHFATSKLTFYRLLELPIINKDNVYFTGSAAIDAIKIFKNNPIPIETYFPYLQSKNYCLMTFNSVTQFKEPIDKIMDAAIEHILNKGVKILITYPNNDAGSEAILNVIDKWKNNENIVVVKHLGAEKYYSALSSALFVIGNSSSGIVEAPYFNVPVLNIGTRQEGREHDKTIVNVAPKLKNVLNTIDEGFTSYWKSVKNNNLFGNGFAINKIIKIIKSLE